MKFYKFCEKVLLANDLSSTKRREPDVVVSIFSPGTVGAHPSVSVKDLNVGFDWDAGRVVLTTETPLCALTSDQVEDITKSVRAGQSWHAYQREKAHKAEVMALRKQRDGLLEALKAARNFITAQPIKTRQEAGDNEVGITVVLLDDIPTIVNVMGKITSAIVSAEAE
jgi:hypothetical protein